MFNEEGYVRDAKAAGLPDEEIRATVYQQRYKNLPQWKKTVGKMVDFAPLVMPLVSGTIGGIAGSMAVPGIGTVYGAGLGTAGGTMAGNVIKSGTKDLLGIPSEQAMTTGTPATGAQEVGGAITDVAAKTSLAGFLASLPMLVNPGGTRQKYINKTDKSTTMEDYNSAFVKAKSNAVGLAAKKQVDQYERDLFPSVVDDYYTGATDDFGRQMFPDKLNINQIYKPLRAFENQNQVFTGSKMPWNKSVQDPVAALVSTELRGLANEKGGSYVKALNAYMSLMNKWKYPLGALATGSVLLPIIKSKVYKAAGD